MRTILLAILMTAGSSAAFAQPGVVRSEADLPPTRFPLAEPASRAFMSDAFLKTTVPALKAEAERILAGNRIEDATIRQRLRSGLAAIDLIEGRPAEAERRILEERAAQTKPQLKAIGILTNEAIAAGLAAPQAGRCAAMGARIAQRLEGTDPLIVRDEALLRLSQAETASPAYYAGTLVGVVDPVVEKQKSVDIMDGMLMALYRAGATYLPGCRAEVAGAFRSWANNPKNKPTDIWPAREPDEANFVNARPVTVAVWDTGLDYGLFAGQLAIDPSEPVDGRDNDNNGIVDDVHGPAYDFRVRPTLHSMEPPSSFLAPRLALSMAMMKGQLDLNYGHDTQEARLFAQRGREASVGEQGADVDATAELGYRSHGTFVSSQIAEGLPFVRLYNVRLLPGGNDPKAVPVSEVEFDRFVAAVPKAVERMKRAGVKVVNMSWGYTIDDGARELLQSGLETDPKRAQQRALAMYGKLRAALDAATRGAPDILFVVAAGNDNQTDATLAAIPQSLGAPNLIVVGATGKSGQPTGFTTFGDNVHIYSRGEGAAGRMPGGMTGHWSGTSMAAPLVARAAAQMLAANPALTPSLLMEGLRSTATPGMDGKMRLVHAANAVNWAKQRK